MGIEYPDAMDRVTRRGDRREDIFHDDVNHWRELLGYVFSGRYKALVVDGGSAGYRELGG
jgi:hypothetical protein